MQEILKMRHIVPEELTVQSLLLCVFSCILICLLIMEMSPPVKTFLVFHWSSTVHTTESAAALVLLEETVPLDGLCGWCRLSGT